MRQRPSVIGIYSPAPQSGKSTISKVLQNKFGYRLLKFAAPIKAMTAAFLYDLGMSSETIQECLEGSLKETRLDEGVLGDLTPRKIMQTLGVEWGRKATKDDLFTGITLAKIKRLHGAGSGVVVDDLRFPNEYAMLRSIPDALIIRVVRPTVQEQSGHGSEGLLDHHEFDWTIHNVSTVEDLWERVEFVMREYHSNDPDLDRQLDQMEQKLK